MRRVYCGLALLVALGAGCAGSASQRRDATASSRPADAARSTGEAGGDAPLPTTVVGARAEIERLERRIAERREELHLASRPAAAPTRDRKVLREPPPVAAGESHRRAPVAAVPSPPPPPPWAQAPAPAPAAPPSWVDTPSPLGAPSAPPPSRATRPGGGRPRSDRCRLVDAAADDICDAAGRVCRIAAQLAEPDATRACAASSDDCREARGVAAACHD